MNPIGFTQPRRLEFGVGAMAAAEEFVRGHAQARVLVITSPSVRPLVEPSLLRACGPHRELLVDDSTREEPTLRHFNAVLAAAREFGPDLVVAAGGGSAIDVGKLVAGLLRGRQAPEEVFGSGLLAGRATTLVCIPTTAGTGSEVSPNSILLDEQERLKKAVISPHLVPDATFFDPALTVTVPASVTAATGLDALTHCIEIYANRFAHPLTDAYALEGIRLIGGALERAVERGGDLEARSDVALGSLLGGLGLGPVNTAAVHALAYPLGSRYGVAHGVSNALLLPHVIAYNLPAAPERYAAVALALGVAPGVTAEETAERGVERLREISRNCGVPSSLGEVGVAAAELPDLVDAALTVQRLLKNNLREVTPEGARSIYEQAFETRPLLSSTGTVL